MPTQERMDQIEAMKQDFLAVLRKRATNEADFKISTYAFMSALATHGHEQKRDNKLLFETVRTFLVSYLQIAEKGLEETGRVVTISQIHQQLMIEAADCFNQFQEFGMLRDVLGMEDASYEEIVAKMTGMSEEEAEAYARGHADRKAKDIEPGQPNPGSPWAAPIN